MRLLTIIIVWLCCAAAAEKRPISPETIKPIGPYSPSMLTQDFLYVSGQGAKNPGFVTRLIQRVAVAVARLDNRSQT